MRVENPGFRNEPRRLFSVSRQAGKKVSIGALKIWSDGLNRKKEKYNYNFG
jgi:hypothetical protein